MCNLKPEKSNLKTGEIGGKVQNISKVVFVCSQNGEKNKKGLSLRFWYIHYGSLAT